jgi:hypothetical protein
LDAIVQKQHMIDQNRERVRKQKMVESSREKAKANHETLRQSMIEEFREDRELAMEEFKQALEDVKVVQLNVSSGGPRVNRSDSISEELRQKLSPKFPTTCQSPSKQTTWQLQEVKVKRFNLALENERENEIAEEQRQANREARQIQAQVEKKRYTDEHERKTAIDDFGKERIAAWKQYEEQLEASGDNKPQLRSPRTTKSPAQASRPGGPMNSTMVTHDGQIIHRSKGCGFNNTPPAAAAARAAQ